MIPKQNIDRRSRSCFASTSLAVIALTAMLPLFSACSFFFAATPEEPQIDYYSKTVEYSAYLDPNEYYLEPVETRLYDDTGALDAVFRYYYEPAEAGSDYYVLVKSEVYTVSNGNESLAEYYTYEYVRDDYAEFDEDDVPYDVTEYLVSHGESFTPGGFRWHYFDVVYQVLDDIDYQAARYMTIRDHEYDSDTDAFVETARQESTYAVVSSVVVDSTTVDYYDYITEKYFVAPEPGEALALTQEFASWYNADGYWTHELFHSIRSSDGTGATPIYFYTKYDWNQEGYVYLQQDFAFDTAVGTFLADETINAPGAYNDDTYDTTSIGAYDLEFAAIGSLVEVLNKSYDEFGNVIQRSRAYNGSEHERIVYRYDEYEEISMARYVQGQSFPYDRTETRFYDQYRDDGYYRVKEELAYRSYESDFVEDSAASIADGGGALSRSPLSRRMPSATASAMAQRLQRPLRSNHDR